MEDSPRIEEAEPETITLRVDPTAADVPQTEVFAETASQVVDTLVKSEIVNPSRFSETNKRVKYQYKNSRFSEARQTIEKYMSEMSQSEKEDLNEASLVYLRYVIVLSKDLDLLGLSKANIELIQPALEQAT